MFGNCCVENIVVLTPFFWALPVNNESQSENLDDEFFLRAVDRAQWAMGSTRPNPCVGAVLVKDGSVIAEGHTHPPGGMHAEKHAIAVAEKETVDATLYVTLEPCSHFGRTPPCTNAIINSGIKRVVFGVVDPNPRVSGSGISALKNAGIEVSQIKNARLIDLASALIKPFQTWVEKKRPYVVVKIATSFDGYFSERQGKGSKITGPMADEIVHHMRRRADAIVVGAQTARIDNPRLTARLGPALHGQQPASVVISSNLVLPLTLNLCNRDGLSSLILTGDGYNAAVAQKFIDQGVTVIGCTVRDGEVDLDSALLALAEKGFTSVMVEAGPTLFKGLMNAQLADEIWWFRSQRLLNSDGPAIKDLAQVMAERGYRLSSSRVVGEDEVFIFEKGKVAHTP